MCIRDSPKTIEIYGSKLYIVGNDFYSTDINTLQLLGQVDGFSDATGCAIVTQNRAFVTDKAESLVKVVDLNDFRIISEIETGEGTSPGFIINKYESELHQSKTQKLKFKKVQKLQNLLDKRLKTVSYTHLTLPTNREV